MLAEIAISVVFTGLLFFGCETKNKTVETVEIHNRGQAAAEEKKTYAFVDVEGKVYEAELISKVPVCTYDYEHLTWENGYPYYKDKDCIAFCDAVREAGKEPFIYANMKWMAFTLELERLTDYKKWYADYEPMPQCPYEFTIWQYTETGSVPGIQGNADLNVWFEK